MKLGMMRNVIPAWIMFQVVDDCSNWHSFFASAQQTGSTVCNGIAGLCGFPVNEILFGVVHNAMSSPSHGFSFLANHENDPIVESLDAGFRGMELDICRCDGKLVLCHGGSLAGCGLGRREVDETFQEIDAWLEDNPDDAITILLEVNNDAGGGDPISLDEVYGLLPESFIAKLYERDTGSDAWPTLGEMIQDCKQVLFFYLRGPEGNPPSGTPPGINFLFDYASQTKFSHSSVSALQSNACDLFRAGTESDFLLLNDFILEGSISPSKTAAETVNTVEFVDPIIDKCESSLGQPVTFVSVDFWKSGDIPELVRLRNTELVQTDASRAQVAVAPNDCRPLTPTESPKQTEPPSSQEEGGSSGSIKSRHLLTFYVNSEVERLFAISGVESKWKSEIYHLFEEIGVLVSHLAAQNLGEGGHWTRIAINQLLEATACENIFHPAFVEAGTCERMKLGMMRNFIPAWITFQMVGDCSNGQSFFAFAQQTGSTVCNGIAGLCGFPVNEILFGVVHNAMSSPSHGFFLFFNHENDPIVESLDAGFRGLELDICRCNGKLVLCHGGSSVGCGLGRREVDETFQEIDAWLEDNPDDAITILLEVNNDAGRGDPISLDEVYGLLPESFIAKLYERDTGSDAWPTLGEMIQDCKQVLFFYLRGPEGDPPSGNPPGINFLFDYASQTLYSHSSVSALQSNACDLFRAGAESDFLLLNDFILEGSIAPSKTAAETVNTVEFVDPIIDKCESSLGQPVTFVSVDFWKSGDIPELVRLRNTELVQTDASRPQVAVAPNDCRPLAPADAPTQTPTSAPTDPPTQTPTSAPTEPPTQTPTSAQTEPPTQTPTSAQTEPPTQTPTSAQTEPPTLTPTSAPTDPPTLTEPSAQTDPPTLMEPSAQTDPPTLTEQSAQKEPPSSQEEEGSSGSIRSLHLVISLFSFLILELSL
eukprot:scaffold747_cov120-Cylindrotheca_fusiformis.AAC.14